MRKPSYAQLEAQVRQLQSDNTKLLQGMNDAIERTINWYKTVRDKDGMEYRFGISRASSACGGLLFIRYSKAGQTPHTAVRYLDDEYANMQHLGGSEWHQVGSEAVYQAIRLRAEALERAS